MSVPLSTTFRYRNRIQSFSQCFKDVKDTKQNDVPKSRGEHIEIIIASMGMGRYNSYTENIINAY